jgi:hypothetical protein
LYENYTAVRKIKKARNYSCSGYGPAVIDSAMRAFKAGPPKLAVAPPMNCFAPAAIWFGKV